MLNDFAKGRPFREGIRENSALYWGLVGASAVAFTGATDFIPELNRWLQIVEMENLVRGSVSRRVTSLIMKSVQIQTYCYHDY